MFSIFKQASGTQDVVLKELTEDQLSAVAGGKWHHHKHEEHPHRHHHHHHHHHHQHPTWTGTHATPTTGTGTTTTTGGTTYPTGSHW